ncbi:hypothetical protein P8C59_006982 [Phyllachora maydis]|uniref:Uncharacterized protein n=1 Tax=Phyllachora maydis TaxID=1825666 RepID=A0AAD9I9C0_9PEZI|nr:hypothetical protein P8C59_006982 [Phyllachora maydis]
MTERCCTSSPPGTKSSSLAPYQLTLASLKRRPFWSTTSRPLVRSGSAYDSCERKTSTAGGSSGRWLNRRDAGSGTHGTYMAASARRK